MIEAVTQFSVAKAHLLFPLLSAMLYSVAMIALKSSKSSGVDTTRATFICNCVIAVAFLIFFDWAHFPSIPNPWWPVLLIGVLFALGQAFTVLAVSCGEVSSIAPVFGVKAVLVGFLAAFVIGAEVNVLTWVGAVLSIGGIACLQVNDRPSTSKKNLLAVLYAFLAASSFASFDAMTQHWSPILGFGNLVPPGMFVAVVLSYFVVPRKKGGWSEIPKQALTYLAIGSGFMMVQALVLIRSIGAYGDAAGANVVYSSRGLWGLVFVWLLGAWFSNSELKERQPKVIYARIAGALLVSSATILVFL